MLLVRTNGDYWDVKSEYKPLLHTWSLGVEEQYYLLYPFLFFWAFKEQCWKKSNILFLLPA